MKKFEWIVSILMVTFAIGFNLWLYRLEPTSAVDPNDNAFQYALVLRTNEIWDWANKTCPQGFFRLPSSAFCHLGFLTDHWVPYWAEGYNLPYYYSHVPQIAIVGTYRFIHWVSQFSIFNFQFSNNFKFQILNIKLFEYYHWIIYLLLCFFPLSVFLSIHLLKPCLPAGRCSWLTAGIGALLASQISTDGLYGIDPASFLWRGWGLSSQLFAMIWMPLALACVIRSMKYAMPAGRQEVRSMNNTLKNLTSYIVHRTSYLLAILFITATTMGHLGMGMMLFLAIPVIAFTQPFLSFLHQQSIKTIWKESQEALFKVILLALPPLILLSYWIAPTVLDSAYHNVSFWDSVWKFNSYGARQVLTNLFNGNLFDFGRPPIFTLLVFVGLFITLLKEWRLSGGYNNKECGERTKFCAAGPALSFLFLFFLLLYFGRTTWGNVLNIIPGMDEFHQHRFIVGVHLIGLFLAPIGFMWIVERIRVMSYALPAGRQELGVKIHTRKIHTSYLILRTSPLVITVILAALLFLSIYKQTVNYGTYNAVLIEKANANFGAMKQDVDELVQTLRDLPAGRIFSGRGGGWGRNFRVAETAYYMFLSTYGFPTVLWMPQTWSPNADTEQYFSENSPASYELYNIRYVLTPVDTQPQPFWKLLKETNSWKLYEIQTTDNRKLTTDYPSSDLRLPSSSGYITAGSSPSVIFSDKWSYKNLVQLWIQSQYPEKRIFPELQMSNLPADKAGIKCHGLPCFLMIDEATYITPDAKTHSLFAEPPVYINPNLPTSQSPNLPIQILSQSNDTDMVFKAKVEIKEKCPTCVLVLKQTFHPNWRAVVNGKSVKPIAVFPFYTAVRLEEPGEYEVVFTYTPSKSKMLLLFGGIGIAIVLFYMTAKKWR